MAGYLSRSVSPRWRDQTLNDASDYTITDPSNICRLANGTNGATNGTGLVFTSVGATFTTSIPNTAGVPTHATWVFIGSASYRISNVDSDTQITLSEAAPADLTGQTYAVRILGWDGTWNWIGINGGLATGQWFTGFCATFGAITGQDWSKWFDGRAIIRWDSAAEPSLTSDLQLGVGFADATSIVSGSSHASGGGVGFTSSQRRPQTIVDSVLTTGTVNANASELVLVDTGTGIPSASASRGTTTHQSAQCMGTDFVQDAIQGSAAGANQVQLGQHGAGPRLVIRGGRLTAAAGLAVVKFRVAYQVGTQSSGAEGSTLGPDPT